MSAIALLVGLVLGIPLLLTAIVYATWDAPPADPDTFPMPPGTGLRVAAVEWIATTAALLAWPFRLRDEPAAGGGAVVFVPEVRCSGASFWLLRRRLRRLGWSSAASPGAASPSGLDAAARALDACISRIAPAADAPLVLVGAGLGGIVARRYAATCPQRIRHVVTLGTPHQGTAAVPYRLLGAAALAQAAQSLVGGQPSAVDVISTFSDYDPWLDPLDNAYCAEGFNITVRGLGHFTLLLSARLAGLVLENVTASR